MPRTAKVFMTNRSQAVRLPKEFQFDSDSEVLEFPDNAATHDAQIRGDLKKLGRMIGANDLFIAASEPENPSIMGP